MRLLNAAYLILSRERLVPFVFTNCTIATISVSSLAFTPKPLSLYSSNHRSILLPAIANHCRRKPPHPDNFSNVPFGFECDFFGESNPLLATRLFSVGEGSLAYLSQWGIDTLRAWRALKFAVVNLCSERRFLRRYWPFGRCNGGFW